MAVLGVVSEMVAYSFKVRFVDPIRSGLGIDTSDAPPDLVRPKLQTIRAIGKRRHARPGEALQLYCGMRSPQCFKIGDAKCIAIMPILIAVRDHSLLIKVGENWIGGGSIHDFARDDGFEHGEDMLPSGKRNTASASSTAC